MSYNGLFHLPGAGSDGSESPVGPSGHQPEESIDLEGLLDYTDEVSEQAGPVIANSSNELTSRPLLQEPTWTISDVDSYWGDDFSNDGDDEDSEPEPLAPAAQPSVQEEEAPVNATVPLDVDHRDPAAPAHVRVMYNWVRALGLASVTTPSSFFPSRLAPTTEHIVTEAEAKDVCGICHDPLIEGSIATKLPCVGNAHHFYHVECCQRWFDFKGKVDCPLRCEQKWTE